MDPSKKNRNAYGSAFTNFDDEQNVNSKDNKNNSNQPLRVIINWTHWKIELKKKQIQREVLTQVSETEVRNRSYFKSDFFLFQIIEFEDFGRNIKTSFVR
jgi:hypothetical protein